MTAERARTADAEGPTVPMTPVGPDAPTEASPGSGARGTDRLEELVSREERLGWHRRLLRSGAIGWVGWTAFLAPDAMVVFVLHEAPALPFLGLRVVSSVLLAVAVLVLWRLQDPGRALLRAFEVGAFAAGAACCGVLAAIHEAGIAAYPVAGATLIILHYGVTLGSPWRKALLPVIGMTLAVPAALLVAAAVSPRIAEQWTEREPLLTFVNHYVMMLAGAALTLIGGQALAGLRQQVAEARSIGRYRLRKRIASGGMGEVWSAYHAGLGRDVAVKLIRMGSATEREVRRFELEVRATAELTHPNTVRVFDYGVTEDGLWYYAMELLDADNLEQLVQREGPLEPHRALRLITQAAQALGEAHGRGIVHRDVKPANLLVQRPGSEAEYVKLIDFGIARVVDSADGMTHTGVVLGTPGYIAPEVVTGRLADARADVYALGAVLYFALVGRMPFESESAQALVLAHVHEDLPTLPPDLPGELTAILTRCLAKDPAHRFEHGDALARALLHCELGAGGAAPRP